MRHDADVAAGVSQQKFALMARPENICSNVAPPPSSLVPHAFLCSYGIADLSVY